MSLDHDFVMWKSLEAEANDAHPFLTRSSYEPGIGAPVSQLISILGFEAAERD